VQVKQGWLRRSGVEMKIVDDEDNRLRWKTFGRLKVRGPAVARAYFGTQAIFSTKGFFDTGDVAVIDQLGLCKSPTAPRT
jgi:fatty-acyl-CoA synthase